MAKKIDDVFLSDVDNSIIMLCVSNLHVAFARVCHRLVQSEVMYLLLYGHSSRRDRAFILLLLLCGIKCRFMHLILQILVIKNKNNNNNNGISTTEFNIENPIKCNTINYETYFIRLGY